MPTTILLRAPGNVTNTTVLYLNGTDIMDIFGLYLKLDASNDPVTGSLEIDGVISGVLSTEGGFPVTQIGTIIMLWNNLLATNNVYIQFLAGTVGEAGINYEAGNVTKVYYDKNDDTFKWKIDGKDVMKLNSDTLTVLDTGSASSGVVVPKLLVDTLTLNGNDIRDSTGIIDFDNEHLFTTGDMTATNFNGTLYGNVNGGNGSFNIIDIVNTTSIYGQIKQEGVKLFHTFVPTDQTPSYTNLFIGYNAGGFGMNNIAQPYLGTGNVGIGKDTLNHLTTGYYNFAIGSGNLHSTTSGDGNLAIGHYVGDSITTGDDNVLIGKWAGDDINAGLENVFIGVTAGNQLTTGDRNTGIGSYAMGNIGADVKENVAIGFGAGRDEDKSGRFIIDNQDRVTAAATRTDAMFYGYFASTPATQNLSINANVNVTEDFNLDGGQTFSGTGRIDWSKITANGVTLTGFTGAGQTVSMLQTANDGTVYTATEVTGGGNDLVVDFAAVTAFNWVKILGFYDGSSQHTISIQIEVTPFDGSTWHTFHAMFDKSSTAHIMENADFFIPSDTAYINSGVVKVRFLHSGTTVNGHTLELDEVSLYQ